MRLRRVIPMLRQRPLSPILPKRLTTRTRIREESEAVLPPRSPRIARSHVTSTSRRRIARRERTAGSVIWIQCMVGRRRRKNGERLRGQENKSRRSGSSGKGDRNRKTGRSPSSGKKSGHCILWVQNMRGAKGDPGTYLRI